MFGPGCAYESLLIDRLAFMQACEWQGVILLPGSKPKGLWCRFGVRRRTLIFCSADLLVSKWPLPAFCSESNSGVLLKLCKA